MSVSLIQSPSTYYREYQNDLPVAEGGVANQMLRMTKVALPLIALNSSLAKPLSLVLGSSRALVSFSGLFSAMQAGDPERVVSTCLDTTIATIALAGTLFAHPLGMLVTTAHDMTKEMVEMMQAFEQEDYAKVAKIGVKLIHNALYFGCFMSCSMELLVATIGVRIFMSLWEASSEFCEGNYLEAAGHAMMAGLLSSYSRSLFLDTKESPAPKGAMCQMVQGKNKDLEPVTIFSEGKQTEEGVVYNFSLDSKEMPKSALISLKGGTDGFAEYWGFPAQVVVNGHDVGSMYFGSIDQYDEHYVTKPDIWQKHNTIEFKAYPLAMPKVWYAYTIRELSLSWNPPPKPEPDLKWWW